MEQLDQQRYKEVLLQTMKVFIDFCREHNITYYACGGTAIGAVRHRGMIPWDDDIDVYMDRANYNRFISLSKELKGKYEGYEVVEFGEDGYYLPLTKFADKSTTIWEVDYYPFIFGVYVDIFPLDFTSGPYEELAARADKYRRIIQSYTQGQEVFRSDLLRIRVEQHGLLKGLASLAYQFGYCRPFRRHLWHRAEKMLLELLRYEGDQGICYGLEYTRKNEVFPKEWFGTPVELQFEDFTVSMPENYDTYLRSQYGDYMQLPPEDKRYSVHGRYFVDLDRRLTVDEVKVLLRAGNQTN